MLIKNKTIRDAVVLTAMQLFLDAASLALNSFITRSIGTSAMGILTLTGSFLALTGTLSNGNAYLCASRLVSEELGRKNGSPNGALACGIKFCTILSFTVSAAVLLFCGKIGASFFGGANVSSALRLAPIALVAGAFSSCLKGYFNAYRRSGIIAAGEIGDFLVRSAITTAAVLAAVSPSEKEVCEITISAIVAGNIFSLAFFFAAYLKHRGKISSSRPVSLKWYARYAIPIMGGGALTAALSWTNDALIPVCLRQNGDSMNEALSRFGIFEAIVLPALFFPSVALCSISGVIVSESAKAAAAGNTKRIKNITDKIVDRALIYSIFAAAALTRFGAAIGEALGGGELAGRIITLTAPVVPFIYMEIALESLIKGLGKQAFSSLNYLAEYAIRISSVLILTPRIGFYGVVVSYYASNVAGNASRFIEVIRITGIKPSLIKRIATPAAYAFGTMAFAELAVKLARLAPDSPAGAAAFIGIWASLYAAVFVLIGEIRINSSKREVFVVHN